MAPPTFPSLPGITFPVKRTPQWSGAQNDSLSGKRVRTSYYSYPKWLYEVQFNFLRTAAAYLEWQQLAGFINQMNGQAGLFLYNDPNDNTASVQTFGTGDGSSTTFQLVRTLGSFIEPVFFPDTPIPTVRVNAVATGAYTVSTTGQIVFTVAPPNGATLDWTGTFKWGCRFDMDEFEFANFATQLFEMRSLKFSSEKLT